jgi:hypothetical protein
MKSHVTATLPILLGLGFLLAMATAPALGGDLDPEMYAPPDC